jgi:hypothetical protein
MLERFFGYLTMLFQIQELRSKKDMETVICSMGKNWKGGDSDLYEFHIFALAQKEARNILETRLICNKQLPTIQFFSSPPRPDRLIGQPIFLSNGYRGGGGVFQGVKQPRREADHSPRSSVELYLHSPNTSSRRGILYELPNIVQKSV